MSLIMICHVFSYCNDSSNIYLTKSLIYYTLKFAKKIAKQVSHEFLTPSREHTRLLIGRDRGRLALKIGGGVRGLRMRSGERTGKTRARGRSKTPPEHSSNTFPRWIHSLVKQLHQAIAPCVCHSYSQFVWAHAPCAFEIYACIINKRE